MASKVIIALPTVASPFQKAAAVQSNLERKDFVCKNELINECENGVHSRIDSKSNDPILKIDQLEKTIRFLKDEQKRMLSSLHEEIASLQAKNRDLLCRLIFKDGNGLDYKNGVNDSDVKYILMTHEGGIKSKPKNTQTETIREPVNGVNNMFELKYTVDQRDREIEYLKGQLELACLRNKSQSCESRRVDTYIREIEEKNRDYEKLVRLLRKENKDQKLELDNLRKALNNARLNTHHVQPHNLQINRVQPQNQMFPPIGTPSPFWCQNRSVPISDYQLPRNTMSASVGDRSAPTISSVSFTLPPVCNYRQVAVTAPPRFYSNTNYYYSVAQRPMLRSQSYAVENCIRAPNENLPNGSNL